MEKNVIKINSENFNHIITQAGDVNSLEFKTIKSKELKEINDWMLSTVNKKTSAFQKQNSQTTMSLMTLNMIDSAPYRILRQILAQVQKKRSALKENMYKLEKKKIKYNNLINKKELTDLEELEKKKIVCDIIDSQGYIESALKELGSLKRRYEEICKNKNIPENWDEEDFEKQEIEHHLKSMARNMVRDRMQGSHNQGSMEYAEQFGIEPILAYALVDQFINQVKDGMKGNQMPSIEMRYQFYDKFYNIFKDEYKKAAKKIGINSITHADFLMKDN